jgi:hypothetical protein
MGYEGGKWKRKKCGNVVRVGSSRGPISYMMGVEVDTSVNLPSLLRRRGCNGRDRVCNEVRDFSNLAQKTGAQEP